MKLIVSREAALTKLKANKDRHIEEYKLQMEAWKTAHTEWTDSMKKWSQNQPTDAQGTKSPKQPVQPQYYVHSYDKLIRKLELHQHINVEIDDSSYNSDYEQIFENKFDWSQSFASMSSGYITTGHLKASDVNTVRGIQEEE